jgi:CelD/BcsL family acetyltransferase involved in cellulose biosynthesis
MEPFEPIVVEARAWHEWSAIRATWGELARSSPHATFFVTPDWVESWLAVFGAALAPTLLLFRSGTAYVGACVLVRRRERRGPFVIRRLYLNTAGEDERDSPCVEFNTLLCEPGSELVVAIALRTYLDREHGGWDELVAEGFAEGPAHEALRLAFASVPAIDQAVPSFYVATGELARSGKEFIQTLGSRDRTRYRQNVRKYGELGELRLERATTVADAVTILDELAALHQKTWRERGEPGVFASQAFCRFHRELIARCFPRGEIELLRLRAGSATIGCLYNFVYRSKVYFYQCGYDYALGERTSPGVVVHAFAIEHAIAAGHAEYDFMAGDVDYKRKLATDQRPLHWLTWRAPTVKMKAVEWLREARARLRTVAQQLASRARLARDAGIGFERTYLYRLERERGPRAAAAPQGLRIAVIDDRSIACIGAVGPVELDACRARLARGDKCYGAWLGNELVHTSWVQSVGDHPIDSAGITVPIAPREFWIYNCRTADAHRGKGIYAQTLTRIAADHFAGDATRGWIYNAEGNAASQRGIARVGFERYDTLRALRFGRRVRPLGR